MLPSVELMRRLVAQCIDDKLEQGHDVGGLIADLAAAPDSYDALLAIAQSASFSPLRSDWPYDEPHDLEAILASADRSPQRTPVTDLDAVAARVRTSFLARVAGCILGKPFEFDPTLDELRSVLEPAGEWPLTDYVTEATAALLRQPQPQWPELVRERITHVAPDDDLNYTVLAMALLEQHGDHFTADDVRTMWLRQLPVAATFGPERIQLIAMATASLGSMLGDVATPRWTEVLNPTEEHCGALIRGDAYGYAHPGDPEAASRLAYVDASVTHRRTGIYAAMWVAAAVAVALGSDGNDRLAPLEQALSVVPQRSRFAAVVRDSLTEVRDASDWLDGYRRIHGAYTSYTHCRVYQEVGTLMVTLRFADDVGHGIGMQVCMGNDTDSFGATAGSLLGAMLGPAAFDETHWLGRFNDRIHLALATEWETSLSALADRMAALARR